MPKSRTLFVIAFCGCILGNAKLDPWFDDEGSDGNEKGKHYFSDAARSAGWAPLAKDTHIPTPVPTLSPTHSPTQLPTNAPTVEPTYLEEGKTYVTSLEEAQTEVDGWRTSFDAKPNKFCTDQVRRKKKSNKTEKKCEKQKTQN
jgi:hypothetical protein